MAVDSPMMFTGRGVSAIIFLKAAVLFATSVPPSAQVVLFLAPVIGDMFPAIAGSSVAGMTQVFFGLVIILFLIFEPRGLAHRWQLVLASFRLWPFPY